MADKVFQGDYKLNFDIPEDVPTGVSTRSSTGGGAAAGASAGGAVGGPWGAAIGGIVGGLGGAFSGLSGGDDGRLHLPVEYELALIDQIDNDLADLDQEMLDIVGFEKTLMDRLDLAQGLLDATLPEKEALEALNSTTMEIAKFFGNNALEAIEQGFLDEESARSANLIEEREGQIFDRTVQEIEDLRSLEYRNLKDPALERDLQQGRAQLTMELERQGVPPEIIAQQLSEFDQQASISRFSRAEELRNAKTQRGLGRVGAYQGQLGQSTQSLMSAGDLRLRARQMGLQNALSQYQASFNQLQFGRSGVEAMAGLAQQRSQAQLGFMTQREGLRQSKLSRYNQMGQYSFSEETEGAIESGLIGPGTFMDQTGVARRLMPEFNNQVAEYDASRFRSGGGLWRTYERDYRERDQKKLSQGDPRLRRQS